MRKKLQHEESFSRLYELFFRYCQKINLYSWCEDGAIRRAANQAYINSLFDLPGEKKIHIPMTIEQIFHFNFRKKMHDLFWFLQKLQISIRFLKNFPSGRKFVEKSEYIKYHIEFFLHNLYAVEERLSELYAKIYKKTAIYEAKVDKNIRNKVNKFFKKNTPMNYRHDLVHEFYSYDTEKLGQLSDLEIQLLTENKEVREIFREEVQIVIPEIREDQVKYLDKILTDLINFITKSIFESNTFFDAEGNLQIPKFAPLTTET